MPKIEETQPVRRGRLSSIVEAPEPTEPSPFKEDVKSPLIKSEVLESSEVVKATEEELMKLDTSVLIQMCKEQGFVIPEEGKNTNKKIRDVILANGGVMNSSVVAPKASVTASSSTRVTSTGKIYIEKGVTKNMGDYNSAKVSVGIELPIDFTLEELEKANEAISVAITLIDTRLEEEVDKLI